MSSFGLTIKIFSYRTTYTPSILCFQKWDFEGVLSIFEISPQLLVI